MTLPILRQLLISVLVPSALVVLVAGAAEAKSYDDFKAEGAQAVLANSDKLTNDYPTQKWVFEMTVTSGGTRKSMEFEVWQKGANKRLVRFLAPGEVKGMSILSKGSKMYVYSPQTDNVRRVATHALRQNLLGSNLNYSDMSSLNFADQYDATFGDDKGAHQWLELKSKGDAVWETLRVRVEKKTLMVDLIEYYDGAKRVRSQTRSDWKKWDGVPTYRLVTMEDADGGLKTQLKMKSQKIGDDIPDSAFKKKNLVRG